MIRRANVSIILKGDRQMPILRCGHPFGHRMYAAECQCSGLRQRFPGNRGRWKIAVSRKGSLRKSDLTNDASLKYRTDEARYAAIRDGIPKTAMPAYRGQLTEAEIRLIIEYLELLHTQQC